MLCKDGTRIIRLLLQFLLCLTLMLLNDGVKFQARKTLSKILFTCAIYLSPISDTFLRQNNAQNEVFYWGVQSAAGKGLQVVVDPNDLNRLKRGLKEINYLLDNWDEKTLYCNFGEFKRELLLPENKKDLLIAAASTGLLDYDKSATMNIKCRADPEVVRAFLGLTQENLLLSKADDLMRKPSTLDRVDEDQLEVYLAAVEDYTIAVSNVDTLGYSARTDFGSTETQSLEELLNSGKNSKLMQSKESVITARDNLAKIINLLKLT